jgi:ribosomal protein S8
MYLFYGYSNAITSIQIISRPGNRCYVTRDQIYNMCRHNREYNGAHYVLRTSLGYLSGNEAIEECIGGEVICRIF